MTFAMPIKSKYPRQDPLSSSSVVGRSSRSIQIGRAATLVAADCAAFLLLEHDPSAPIRILFLRRETV